MIPTRLAASFSVLALSLSTALFAQQPAAPAAAPFPKHACVKPGEHPGRLASETQQRNWTKGVNAYLECLKKFVAEEQAIAKPLIEQTKPHIDAANAAIDEYNASSKDFREQLSKLDQ